MWNWYVLIVMNKLNNMKKLLCFISLIALMACSAGQEEILEQKSDLAKVTFGFQLVSEVPMTKAVNNTSIAQWIESQLPEKLSLKLIDANGVRYTVETGASVELPTGIYTVTGKNVPSASASVIGSDVFMSVTRPTITVNTTIEVTFTQTTYIVPATYGAFGIVIDKEETASASYTSSHGEQGNIEFAEVGTAGIVFVNGNLGTFTLDVTLNPVSSSDEITTHRFQTNYSATTISPTFGNYYIIHPKGISSVDGGTFSYSIGNFRAVDIENE